MFGTIRRHQTWLWAVIITFTVISFVIYFSPYSKMNNVRRVRPDLGSVYGHKISEEAFLNAQREVLLRYLAFTGRWPDEQARQNLDRETYDWLLFTRKQEMMGIHISTDKVADMGREMVHSLQRAGINSAAELAKVLEAQGFSMDDFERFVTHYLGLQQMLATLGASGKLSTPEELKSLYVREHQELATAAAFFNGSNYLNSITVTPDAVQQFYTNELAVYRVPERLQVDYVAFPISNYLAQAEQTLAKTNLSEIVDMEYQAEFERYGTNLFRETKTPEAAKKRIRDDIIRGQAARDARRKASEFLHPLLDVDQPSAAGFAASAKTNGLTVQAMEPFSRETPPKDLEGNEEFAPSAFKLTPQYPLAGAFNGREAIYVIALNKRIPSEIPALDKIRERVVADYRYEQAKNLARQTGLSFYTALTNGLAQGKTFETICTEAKVKSFALPAFSISTRSLPGVEEHISLNMLQQLAFTTAPGKASGFQWTTEGGVVLFVKNKLPIDEVKMKAELPAFIAAARQQRQQDAFQLWYQQEYSRNVRALLAQPQQQPPPNMSSRAAKKS